MIEWEDVEPGRTTRARIPGLGWLVMVSEPVIDTFNAMHAASRDVGWEWRPALTFIPDPEGRWAVDENQLIPDEPETSHPEKT